MVDCCDPVLSTAEGRKVCATGEGCWLCVDATSRTVASSHGKHSLHTSPRYVCCVHVALRPE